MTAMHLKTRVVALTGLGPGDIERWHTLAARAMESNAFLDPRWLLPFGHPSDGAATTRLLIVEDSQAIRALMCLNPVERRIRGLHVAALSSASPFGSRWTARHFPLIDPDHPVDAWEGLLRGLRNADVPGLVDMEGFPIDTPLGAALLAAAARSKIRIVERGSLEYAFRLRGPEDLPLPSLKTGSEAVTVARLKLDQLSASSGKRYLQHFRALERHTGGSLTLIDRGNDPDALEEFLDLQAAGWKGKADRGGNAIRTTGYDTWFAEAAAAFRAENGLSVFALTDGKVTLYMQVAIRSGRGLFAAQDAYDETFSKFRPGALGRLAVLEHSMSDTSADFFDPNMHPRHAESSKLYPDRRRYVSLLIATRGLVPNALVRSIPVMRRVRNALRAQATHEAADRSEP